ncbi:hypothetical protein J2T26_004250 [Citrobacter farmeri]|nr:hypothetical protein [Citrobacter farmeri]MCW2424591.1 hypothetical protein [Citrobacter farmeri]
MREVPEGALAHLETDCSRLGREWRRQIIHGLRTATGAYLMYVRSSSTSRGQNDK